jgi:general nucleoside transport system ATP-binding protein
VLEARGLSKRFDEVQANSGVDLVLRAGEVHAILGENGAGKSVLAKTLYGVHRPDEGTILVDSEPVIIGSPANARALGIGLVFQEFRLVPALTVLQNVALALPRRGFALKRKEVSTQITTVGKRYGINVEPGRRVRTLSMGERQQVEIIKLLLSGARIMLLDEPTSLLAPQEVDALSSVLRELRDEGLAIGLITHKLSDVRAVADRVTVLRGGVVTAQTEDVARTTDAQLIEAIVGRRLPPLHRQTSPVGDEQTAALNVTDVDVEGERGQLALREVSFSVARGEIVGVAGVSGSGQRELAEAVLGLRKILAGRLEVLGQDVTRGGPARVLEAGAAGISEGPFETDVVPGLSVTKHMALSRLKAPKRGLGYDWKALERELARLPEATVLQLPPGSRQVTTLSGGNLQRLVVARALAGDPGLVIAAYPTRGLDLATVAATQSLLVARAEAGAGILLMSEDLDELFLLSDRILVLHAGRVVASLEPKATTPHEVGSLMLGKAT